MLKKKRSCRNVSFLILLTFVFTIIGPSFTPSESSLIHNSTAITPGAIHKSLHSPLDIFSTKTVSAATGKAVQTASVNSSSTAGVSIKTLAPGTIHATELYVIKSGKPGPTVMFIGGVHGNETAGYKAAQQLTKYRPSKGTILVIPQANKRAIAANKRTAKGSIDLNRAFPTTKNGSANGTLAKAILKVMKDYKVDWVMDMHEGYDYAKNTSNSSVGQSVIYYPSSQMTPLAKKIVSSLNTGIKYKSKQFSLLKYPVKGSAARCAAVTVGANSFIFESCSKETLNKRVNNQLKAANILLNHLGMN
ncbi:Succinylglutamate desuccinylase/aspartoacylase [Syntrophomonas zehnderi OL-4]|uniref:Succinylglutamate desuccinylase/aspartoacylase n=1 Tax=Syntrophomonas zehnderi OL-4 TaxID=690567 RepID=A0A0E4GCY2_9FIRM|nr:succinylglutamate desuccinylase/aspartoacylase family protein [Syntrophomonas zehnderi]CFY10552.1 Succinylglutamate desuccinylase/aspartoacylase [Syntrophomonas zehnderi OL-4]